MGYEKKWEGNIPIKFRFKNKLILTHTVLLVCSGYLQDLEIKN